MYEYSQKNIFKKIKKKLKLLLTKWEIGDIITPVLRHTTKTSTERYRSGHNEAVLKTVCPQGHVGSNPTLSVIFLPKSKEVTTTEIRFTLWILIFLSNHIDEIWRSTQAGRRDTPGKGAGR